MNVIHRLLIVNSKMGILQKVSIMFGCVFQLKVSLIMGLLSNPRHTNHGILALESLPGDCTGRCYMLRKSACASWQGAKKAPDH